MNLHSSSLILIWSLAVSKSSFTKKSKLADNFSLFIGNTGIYELTEERG